MTGGRAFLHLAREKPVWVLVLGTLFYTFRVLFNGETYFFRDLHSQFIPQRELFVSLVRAGEIPLWNTYLDGGQAYLANIANAALYPPNLIYLCLPLFRALNVTIVVHLLACALGSYLLARALDLTPVSALVVGTVYAFSGYTLSLINLLNYFLAMPYIPLLLLSWHLFVLRGSPKWFGTSVLLAVLQLLAGSPETAAMTHVSVLGWTFCWKYPRCSALRRTCLWGFFEICVAGATMVQLLPTAEIASYSSRAAGFDSPVSLYWSLHPGRIPELVFPGFVGHLDVAGDSEYWGGSLSDGGFPLIISFYLGAVSLALAALGAFHPGEYKLSRRFRVFLLCLFAISVLLSLGRFIPLLSLLSHHVPFMRSFRYPSKFLEMGVLPLALLAGYATDVHFDGSRAGSAPGVNRADSPLSLKVLTLFWGIGLALVLVAGAFLYSDAFVSQINDRLFQISDPSSIRRGLAMSAGHAAATVIVMALVFQYRRIKRNPYQHWMIAATVLVDLLSAGSRINPSTAEQPFVEVPALVDTVREEIGEGRLLRAEIPSPLGIRYPTEDVAWRYLWCQQTLGLDMAAYYHIPVIYHNDVLMLAPAGLGRLRQAMNSLPWERRVPILSAGRVRLILTHEQITVPGLERIAVIPNLSIVPLYLYRNPAAVRKTELVTDWLIVDSDSDALRRMAEPGFDPRQRVVLQEPDSPVRPPPISVKPPPADVERDRSHTPEPARIVTLRECSHSVELRVRSSLDGFLVFSELWYPGWQICIDGRPAPVWRANHAFSAVFLPAGDHTIERRYRPSSLILGACVSLVFSALVILVSITGWGIPSARRQPLPTGNLRE